MTIPILGLDPGIGDLGWGVIEFEHGKPRYKAHGDSKTEPGGADWTRVRQHIQVLRGIVKEHNVQAIGLEDWGFYRDQVTTAAHQLGLVMGAILGAFSYLPVVSVGTAAEWHASLGLPPKAKKKDVQLHVQRVLRLPKVPTPQHAADALGVALVTFSQAVRYLQPRTQVTPP